MFLLVNNESLMKVEISLNENVKVFSVLEWMYIDLLVDDCGCDWIGVCLLDERTEFDVG
jgi:hypothetical protein